MKKLSLILASAVLVQAAYAEHSLPSVKECFSGNTSKAAAQSVSSLEEKLNHVCFPGVFALLGVYIGYTNQQYCPKIKINQINRELQTGPIIGAVLGGGSAYVFVRSIFPTVAQKIAKACSVLKKRCGSYDVNYLAKLAGIIDINPKTGSLTDDSRSKIIALARQANFLHATNGMLGVVEKLDAIDPVIDELRLQFDVLNQRNQKKEATARTLNALQTGLDADAEKLALISSVLKESEEYQKLSTLSQKQAAHNMDMEQKRSEIEKNQADTAKANAEKKKAHVEMIGKVKEIITGKKPAQTVVIE